MQLHNFIILTFFNDVFSHWLFCYIVHFDNDVKEEKEEEEA